MKEFVFHGIITREENQYKAMCLELDITFSGGSSPEEARENLKEAVEEHMQSRQEDNGRQNLIPGFSPEEVMEKYSSKLIQILSAPRQFPEFYQFKEVATYTQPEECGIN